MSTDRAKAEGQVCGHSKTELKYSLLIVSLRSETKCYKSGYGVNIRPSNSGIYVPWNGMEILESTDTSFWE